LIATTLIILILALFGAAVAFSFIETARIERQFPPIGEFAGIGDIRLHYVDLPADDPDAPVIVFIHGASGNLRDPLTAFRAELIGRYRLIFVDRPGHGYSTRGASNISAPVAQAEVIHQLLGKIGISRAVIVGHSWGAAVASAYAVRFQAATAGLLLLAPATHPWPGGVDWYYGVATAPIIGTIFRYTLVMPIGLMQMPGALDSVFAPTPVPATYAASAGTTLVLRPDEFLANAEDVGELKANVIAMSPRYKEITAPAIIIAGAEDTVVRNDLHADALAREIRGAELVTLEKTGHMPQFSAPAVVLAAIERLAEGARTHGFASLGHEPQSVGRPM
jgi:pimeloyl-ACP methyl ester carboxylesterase